METSKNIIKERIMKEDIMKKEIAGQNEKYYRTKMKKDKIINELRSRGGRITKQRSILLDIILEEECASCKEIYYKALKYNKKIGTATIYRMVNTLEEIGAISRKNMYRIEEPVDAAAYKVEFEDNTSIEIPANNWNQVIKQGLISCGYITNKDVTSIIAV